MASPLVTEASTRTPFFASAWAALSASGLDPVASNIRSKGPYRCASCARSIAPVQTYRAPSASASSLFR